MDEEEELTLEAEDLRSKPKGKRKSEPTDAPAKKKMKETNNSLFCEIFKTSLMCYFESLSHK